MLIISSAEIDIIKKPRAKQEVHYANERLKQVASLLNFCLNYSDIGKELFFYILLFVFQYILEWCNVKNVGMILF